MSDIEMLQKLNVLDDESKLEVVDFIDFLIQKKQKITKKHPKAGFLKNNFKILEGFEDIPDSFKEYL